MYSEPPAFPIGVYYMIICKSGDLALRMQQNDPNKFDRSRIIGVQPNPQDPAQLFMVEKVGVREDEIQIINCISDQVFDEQSSQIRLKQGKRRSDQLFAIKLAPVQQFYRYYWIKTDSKGEKAVSLEGILRLGQFDQNSPIQLFRFQPVTNSNILNTSALIINNLSGKYLDAPASSKKPGQRILLWHKNKRFNQRWQFQRQGKGVVIRNLINGLYLDIYGQGKKDGTQVIQWHHTGGANQLWYPEPCGNGLFKFRSVHEPTLFLAVKKQKIQDGGQLEVSSKQNPSMYWKVQGCQP